jgi:hypothetical protein
MKTPSFLTLIFITLINLTVFSQVRDTTLIGLQVDTNEELIKSVLDDFKYESRTRGLYIDHYISQHLGGIKVMTSDEMVDITGRLNPVGVTYRLIQYDFLGYWHATPMIGLREDILPNYHLTKIVLFHELGHFFGLDHVCCSDLEIFKRHIMVPVLNSEYKEPDAISEKAMDDFFKKIKTIDKRKRMKRNSNNH